MMFIPLKMLDTITTQKPQQRYKSFANINCDCEEIFLAMINKTSCWFWIIACLLMVPFAGLDMFACW